MADTELLTDQQIAEIESREYIVEGWGRFIKLRPDERDSLIATVKQLQGMVYLPKILADDDDVTYERLSGRLLREKIDLQSQLEQLRAENERLRAELEKESLTADAYAADADVGDSFRSRAVDLCNQKAAEYERAMRHRKTREAFTKTYADAVSEIRKALEAH